MPRRTAQAAKAVREAWIKEQELVLEGKGTRDWTPEQQQSIIDKGKAYDDDGKAFEGHHMKSVEAHPEYQSCADNIQFLTRAEHQEAHGGSFGNATNGYYDYITGKTICFGEEPYKPCAIIELSEPAVLPVSEDLFMDTRYDETFHGDDLSIKEPVIRDKKPIERDEAQLTDITLERPIGLEEQIATQAKGAVETFKQNLPLLVDEYWPIIKQWGLRVIVVAGIPTLVNYLRRISGGQGDRPYTSSNGVSADGDSSAHDGNDYLDDAVDDTCDTTADDSAGMSRKSPIEHPVRSHERTVHTKEGDKRVPIPSYRRGGKK